MIKICTFTCTSYPTNNNFKLKGYSDADYAGSLVDRKSTCGKFFMLGHSLVAWSSRKQNCIALSTTEAEYTSLSGCSVQTLWMIQTLQDYGLNFKRVPLMRGSKSVIDLTNNHVHHYRTKKIDVRHHFIRDHISKENNCINFISTDFQLVDIFTKLILENSLCGIRLSLGILEI